MNTSIQSQQIHSVQLQLQIPPLKVLLSTVNTMKNNNLFEYFVVCGIGPEIKTIDGSSGYYGFNYSYEPCLIDQYPPSSHSLYAPLPPELPVCVMPAGVEFYKSGFDADDPLTFPRSYPIVLTAGDGSKIYVSCIAFRDPVDDDIEEAYGIPQNSFSGKCLSLVSRIPFFSVLRDALEEIFALCFSTRGSSKPLWKVIEDTVSKVPLPTPGIDRVLFTIDNCLFTAEAPLENGLPHADISFEPLVNCLDAHNIIILFTAVLLERRILLRSDKYTLLTLVSEAICHLIYPFQWQHVYIPLLFAKGVDYVDAPTPYIIGLHSSVDTSGLSMDGVVIVDIDHNCISTSEEIPSVPEPELTILHDEIMKLLYPNMMQIDDLSTGYGKLYMRRPKVSAKPWGKDHDFQLRLIFLKFLATALSGYQNYVVNNAEGSFDSQKFIIHRSHSNNGVPDPMITQFLDSQGFSNYIGRVVSSRERKENILDKLIDVISRGENPLSLFPSPLSDFQIITIPDSVDGGLGSGANYTYAKFPANFREEEEVKKRKQILAYIKDKTDEEKGIVLDMKVKLQGLWISLLKLEDADAILSSDEFETILALVETDGKGIVGRAVIESIREHFNSGWKGKLSKEHFIAVKELVKGLITCATYQNDVPTLIDALEVSAEIYKKDFNNVSDYIQRHLLSLPIWEDSGFWEAFFDYLMEQSSSKSSSKEGLIMSQLIIIASHMGGLGIPDTDAWSIIQTISQKNNINYDHYIQLRSYLSYLNQLQMVYWGISDLKAQSLFSSDMQFSHSQDASLDGQQPFKASTLARNWVRSMFGRESVLKVNSFSHGSGWTLETEGAATNESGTPRKQNLPNTGQKRVQTNVRVLRGHNSAVTALHCVTKKEVLDLVSDREDAGFFFSGSTDCTINVWDPVRRGSELQATLRGHTGAIRAITSDRWKLVSGSDDQSVVIWDKHEFIVLEELKGHEAPVSGVRMLSGDQILSSSHDGTVKMWDARNGSCIATVARCPGAVLCMEYDDTTNILTTAGRDSVIHVWDIRAGKRIHKLSGHSKWVRSIRMVGDTVITGSDDWTARIWSISRGSCDAVLASHSGPILTVEYSDLDGGIITGSQDGLVKFWENDAYNVKCTRDMKLNSSILSINAVSNWLGIGAADNSMLLLHQPMDRTGGWKLYRTPQFSPSTVRCVASDLVHKRICSGGRDGRLRLWDATINI